HRVLHSFPTRRSSDLNIDEIGDFPERLKPISIKTDIDADNEFIKMQEVNQTLDTLLFSIYQPMKYILPSKRKVYEELYDTQVKRSEEHTSELQSRFDL